MRVLLIGDSQGFRMFRTKKGGLNPHPEMSITHKVQEDTGVDIDWIFHTGWGNDKYATNPQKMLQEAKHDASSSIKSKAKGKTLAQFLESSDPYDIVAVELGGNDWGTASEGSYRSKAQKMLEVVDLAEPKEIIWIGVFGAHNIAGENQNSDVSEGKGNVHKFQEALFGPMPDVEFVPMLPFMQDIGIDFTNLTSGSKKRDFDSYGVHLLQTGPHFDAITTRIADVISDAIEGLEGEEEEPAEPFEMFPEEEESYYEQMEFDAEDLEFEDVAPEEPVRVVEKWAPPPAGTANMVQAYKHYSGWRVSDQDKFQIICEMLTTLPQDRRPDPLILTAITGLESGGKPYVIRFESHVFNKRSPNNKGRVSGSDQKAFDKAFSLDPKAAVLSTSWGLGQVMGFNFLTQDGFPYAQNPQGFVEAFIQDPLYWSVEVEKYYLMKALQRHAAAFVEASHANPQTGGEPRENGRLSSGALPPGTGTPNNKLHYPEAEKSSSMYIIGSIYNAGGGRPNISSVYQGKRRGSWSKERYRLGKWTSDYPYKLRKKWEQLKKNGWDCGDLSTLRRTPVIIKKRQGQRDITPFDHPVVPADGGGMGGALVLGGLAVGLGWFIIGRKGR